MPSPGDNQVVYLVRHGDANTKQQDSQRGLTAGGVLASERVATWMSVVGMTVDRIRHSDKLRARQTAEIFGKQLSPAEPVAEMSGLEPNADVRSIADWINGQSGETMIVGHMPFLGRLVGELSLENSELSPVQFEPATVAVLRRGVSRWSVDCIMPARWCG